jgi:hypothetical protein
MIDFIGRSIGASAAGERRVPWRLRRHHICRLIHVGLTYVGLTHVGLACRQRVAHQYGPVIAQEREADVLHPCARAVGGLEIFGAHANDRDAEEFPLSGLRAAGEEQHPFIAVRARLGRADVNVAAGSLGCKKFPGGDVAFRIRPGFRVLDDVPSGVGDCEIRPRGKALLVKDGAGTRGGDVVLIARRVAIDQLPLQQRQRAVERLDGLRGLSGEGGRDMRNIDRRFIDGIRAQRPRRHATSHGGYASHHNGADHQGAKPWNLEARVHLPDRKNATMA